MLPGQYTPTKLWGRPGLYFPTARALRCAPATVFGCNHPTLGKYVTRGGQIDCNLGLCVGCCELRLQSLHMLGRLELTRNEKWRALREYYVTVCHCVGVASMVPVTLENEYIKIAFFAILFMHLFVCV